MSRRGVPLPYEHFHGGMTRPEVIRGLYRKWSREGQTREWMLKNITNMDGRIDYDELNWMDDHVKQMFYQMVRKLLRMAPPFGRMLDVIERGSGKSQDQVLEHVRKQLWAKMQQIDDDSSHTEIYRKIQQLYFTFEAQLRDAAPNPVRQGPPRRSGSVFGVRPPRAGPTPTSGIRPHLWIELDAEEESALIPEFWDAFDAMQ